MFKKNSQFSNYIIITDGLWRKSLAAVRSLGKAGCIVEVMGDTFLTPSFYSRYTSKKTLSPNAKENSKGFGSVLKKRIKELYSVKPILIPMEDATMIWVLKNIDFVNKYCRVLLPSLESFMIASNKANLMKLAQELSIPHPHTYFINSWKHFQKEIGELKTGSFVIKPCSSSGSHGILYKKLADKTAWKKYWDKNHPVVVQERIPMEGEAIGVCLLMDNNSSCIASFTHKRLQQYPNNGGPSTDRISAFYPNLEKLSLEILKKISWKGVAMVEWKVDSRDKQIKLIEINPRFWGSLELAIRAGVNFPLLYTHACHKIKFPKPNYKLGVRCRWLIPGDILRYITQSPQKRESLFKFFHGLPKLAEEWDTTDVPGFFATFVCTILLAMNPKYWRFLKRG